MELIKRILGAMHNAKAAPQGGSAVAECGRWQPKWIIEKYRGSVSPENLYAVEHIDGNSLLNEGITELLQLLIGATATPFNNANARLGVGDSPAAVTATQTDLQGANKTYKPMDTGYPQVNGQTVTFKATFAENDANYQWQEFVVDNGATGGKTLNRKVENHGTKASGDIWVLTLNVTIS